MWIKQCKSIGVLVDFPKDSGLLWVGNTMTPTKPAFLWKHQSCPLGFLQEAGEDSSTKVGSRSSDSDEEVGIRKPSVFLCFPRKVYIVKMYEDVVISKEVLQATRSTKLFS